MKKIWTILWILLIWSLGVGTLNAAPALPDRTGSVSDQAGLFPKDKLKSLESSATGAGYTFYILTLDSLDGENPAALATAAYEKWKLQENDILLLLANREHRIEMNFKNSSLQKRLDALPPDYDRDGVTNETKLDEFVTVHFIPSAKAGDYVRAAIQLMDATRRLPEPAASAPVMPAAPAAPAAPVAPVAPASPAAPGVPVAPVTDGVPVPASSPFSYAQAGLFLAGCAAAVLAVWAAAAWFMQRRIRRLKDRGTRLLVSLARIQEELRPFHGLSEGTTARLSEKLGQELAQLMIRVSDWEAQREQSSGYTLLPARWSSSYARLTGELDQLEAAAAQADRETAAIVEADRSVKEQLQALREDLAKLVADLQRISAETGFPLPVLRTEAEGLLEEHARADALKLFDPVEAVQAAQGLAERLSAARRLLEAVLPHREKYHAYPSAMADARKRIDALTQEHGINIAVGRLKPHSHLEQAAQLMEQLWTKLQEGDMHPVIKLGEEADRLLSDAVSVTERQVRLKEQNAGDLGTIGSRSEQLRSQWPPLNEGLARVRREYDPSHWTELDAGEKDMRRLLEAAVAGLPEIRELTADSRQEYDLARTALDRHLAELHESERLSGWIRDEIAGLDRRLAEAAGRAEQLRRLQQDTRNMIRHESLPVNEGWKRQLAYLEEADHQVDEALGRSPRRLDRIEDTLEEYRKEAESLRHSVERMAEEKRDAERRYREALARYRSVSARAGSRIRLGASDGQLSSAESDIGRLMALGLFAEAMSRISEVDSLADRLDREYRQLLEAEEAERRRQEQERQAQSQSSGGSSWDSGSSGSSDSGSSGESSDSGNSSGGSNW
ncbi:TPM domain-containing protein [Gorillibacterium sp. sgz5001074]|uniref:TPM domain-containing protein n=1 Tax=Gorillibacterium sp. sgz5001074 TaxID=3446695 RepID=UPI003F66E88A